MNLERIERDACPCGSNKKYAECCAQLHLRLELPVSAEALMRSRFAAFAFASLYPANKADFEDYLLQTWHIDYRPVELQLDTQMHWLKLHIKGRKEGKKRHQTGKVHFIATYQVNQQLETLE